MSACLGTPVGFAATWNLISPLPWPLAGVKPEIQPAAVSAVHPHSASADTLKLPVPPAASMAGCSPVTATRHFAAGDGLTDVVAEDPHAATAQANATPITRSSGRAAGETEVTRLCRLGKRTPHGNSRAHRAESSRERGWRSRNAAFHNWARTCHDRLRR